MIYCLKGGFIIDKDLNKTLAVEENVIDNDFVTNLSHELRTPINVIFSAIQLFELYIKRGEVLNSEKHEYHMNSIRQNCSRLIRIVNNFVDVVSIESDSYKPKFNNYNIVEIVENIALKVSEFVKLKNITITYETQVKEIQIACDIDMIERIILNLISNAIKFTKNIINISIAEETDGVVIIIQDNGKGVKKKNHNLIFEKYKKASNLYTQESEGIGIGLYLTKMFVEMHGGVISIKSEYGKGCEFIVKLPNDSKINKIGKVDANNYICDHDRIVEKVKIEFSDIYK